MDRRPVLGVKFRAVLRQSGNLNLFLVNLYFSNTLTIKHLFVDSCIVFPRANSESLCGISRRQMYASAI